MIFRRGNFIHIDEASEDGLHPDGKVDLVVNCTGLMASKLGGVEDKKVHAARGQIVLVRNEAQRMYASSGTDDGPDEACYVMTRAAGGGTTLGGCYQKDNWDDQVDMKMADRIMKRAIQICPELTRGRGVDHLDVVRHGVGLRPVRDGGTRIERECINNTWVVHNYGAGGAGYQSSYGCAKAAKELVDETFGQASAS